jgi:unsaturated rhamnogalacturonyl hydrolase
VRQLPKTSPEPDNQAKLRLLADSLLDLSYQTWGFGDSVAFEALVTASDILRDPTYAAFAHGWMRAWASSGPLPGELDCTAPGRTMVHLALRTGDSQLITAAVTLADYLLSRPTINGVYQTWARAPLTMPYGPAKLDPRQAAWLAAPPGGAFLDCLHFDPPFLTALGRATGSQHYLRAGVDQALALVAALQQADGSFDHFVLKAVPGSFGPAWGRGQGWALLGLLDTITSVDQWLASSGQPDPPLAAQRAALANACERLVGVMVATQRPDGHWYAVIDGRTASDETSTAAFMGAGLPRALALGLIPNNRLADVAKAARAAQDATAQAVTPDGCLAGVSAAVMACTEPSHYAHVPTGFRVPWGQGPALLALAAREAS